MVWYNLGLCYVMRSRSFMATWRSTIKTKAYGDVAVVASRGSSIMGGVGRAAGPSMFGNNNNETRSPDV